MTWARTLETGNGTIAWRVMVEGFPFEAVSHKGMEKSLSDGRERKVGLKSGSVRISEKVDLITAKWEPQGFRVEVADVKGVWTEAFSKEAQAVNFLDGDISDSDTTITVKSTAAFPSSGVIHIAQEAIAYTNTTSTTFTGCTRGAWDTFARYHYTANGARLAFPEVTDLPSTIEGRRVYLYAYGAGDDKQGDGTLVWRGVAASDAQSSGPGYSFLVDSPAKLLATDLGGDLEDPSVLRGIYYPATAPFTLVARELSGVNENSDEDKWAGVAIAGHWESQEAFCATVTSAIASAMTTASFIQTDVGVYVEGAQWAVRYTTDAADPRYMKFSTRTPVDGLLVESRQAASNTRVLTVASSTSYRALPANDSVGLVPRAIFGHYSVAAELAEVLTATDIDPATYPPWRIYVNGSSVTSNVGSVAAEWDSVTPGWPHGGEGASGPFTSPVDAVSAADGHLDLFRPQTLARPGGGGPRFYSCSGTPPEFRFGRDYGAGNLGDFLTTLAGQSAEYANTGAVPDIRPTDFVNDGVDIGADSDIDSMTRAHFQSRRTYSAFAEVDLNEMIEHECRLLGVFPALTSTGQITFRKLRLPSPSEVGDNTLTKSDILVRDGFYAWERGALGTLGTVIIRTGYDPIEEEHTGRPFKVRDVSAHGRAGGASKVLMIEPKSTDPGPVTLDDALTVGGRVLGIFGAPYVYLQVKVPLTRFDILVGDIVSLTWAKVPNDLGTRGINEKLGYVVSREWEPMSAKGELTILLTGQRVGGYAPSSKVTVSSGTSGTQGPFDLACSSTYFPSGTTAEDFFEAGYKVRLFRYDSTTTSGNVTGEVDSVSGNTVSVTTDANWTHTTGSWVLGFALSTAISDTESGQKVYVAIARSDGHLHWSDDATARPFTLAP